MDIKTAAFGTAFVAALWLGIKPLLKQGKHREYMLYATMIVWAAYLFASEHFEWPPMTLVTLMTLMVSPIEHFLNIMSWLR
ncbi:hypothetical protein [Paenibacillus sp. PL91]|uniref:hypothetical protein n=1 Tax=Paenibacillus sp. PL91 TaxID=2729538 RepID=UPI00145E5EE0|nr:hypothetical protein [Paenibacillus sp. PL91]MBC9202542.1 hypothetical protein [Paenibacillus sp. PL91]